MIGANEKKSFILKCAEIRNEEKFLKIYNGINDLYHSWGETSDVDVEISVKVAGGRINYNRYILPITGEYASDDAKMDQVIRAMEAPECMSDIAMTLHADRVSAMVGFDYDSGGRKIYFYHGKKGFGYEFAYSQSCGLKVYSLVNKESYGDVLKGISKALKCSVKKEDALRKIVPPEDWAEVCEMKRFSVNDERTTYDISTYKSRQLQEIGDSLIILVEGLIEDDEKRKFIAWVSRNSSIYLYWIGIGAGKDGVTEITLYMRSEA